jgi:hypothetical protein
MGSVQKHHERSLFTGVCSISDENNARNTNLPTLINQISGAFQKQPYKRGDSFGSTTACPFLFAADYSS